MSKLKVFNFVLFLLLVLLFVFAIFEMLYPFLIVLGLGLLFVVYNYFINKKDAKLIEQWLENEKYDEIIDYANKINNRIWIAFRYINVNVSVISSYLRKGDSESAFEAIQLFEFKNSRYLSYFKTLELIYTGNIEESKIVINNIRKVKQHKLQVDMIDALYDYIENQKRSVMLDTSTLPIISEIINKYSKK